MLPSICLKYKFWCRAHLFVWCGRRIPGEKPRRMTPLTHNTGGNPTQVTPLTDNTKCRVTSSLSWRHLFPNARVARPFAFPLAFSGACLNACSFVANNMNSFARSSHWLTFLHLPLGQTVRHATWSFGSISLRTVVDCAKRFSHMIASLPPWNQRSILYPLTSHSNNHHWRVSLSTAIPTRSAGFVFRVWDTTTTTTLWKKLEMHFF